MSNEQIYNGFALLSGVAFNKINNKEFDQVIEAAGRLALVERNQTNISCVRHCCLRKWLKQRRCLSCMKKNGQDWLFHHDRCVD
jgi:hypothetical protein